MEAKNAPIIISPKGNITQGTPTFQWNPVPGVPGYWLILSSTPFQVVTLPNGTVSVQGADVLWNFITKDNSVQYGTQNPNSPFDAPAPPLLPGNEYNFTVLNLYDLKDVSFASSVFSGAVSFTYTGVKTIDAPKLVTPLDKAIFYADENINFNWDPVQRANTYTIYLMERVTSFAGNEQQIDLPVWSSSTTNTEMDYPARTTLKKGKYVWYVIPSDNSGAGNISVKRTFQYIIQTGAFRASALSSVTGESLVGFEIDANSISGGVSPPLPFLVSNSTSYVDSLVLGTYEFIGKKDGYFDSAFVYQINAGSQTTVQLKLRPHPAIVSGTVNNSKGVAVQGANVSITNILNNKKVNTSTDASGKFSKSLNKGTYYFQASKPGYLASKQITISLSDPQTVISSPFVVILDNVSLSGKVVNDANSPIKLASVTATQGTVLQQLKTDESGNFNFTLSSGEWKVEVKKDGFISPAIKTYNFAPQENIQNQNFVLIPRANQVNGFVYKTTKTASGSVGTNPFDAITVTAVPTSGTPTTAVSNSNGQYNLSLKSGSYTISAFQNGYSSSSAVQLNLNLNVAETITGINFTLTANPSSISGTISEPGSAGISEAVISTLAGETTRSLPNGQFTISVAGGTKTVSVTKPGYITPSSKVVSVAPGQNLTGVSFEMSPNAGAISGRVTSQQATIVEATVTATSGTSVFTTTTNQEGQYNFNLKPATWSLKASKQGFVSSAPKSVIVGPGQVSSQNNFNLVQNIAIIQGSITSNSLPVKNATLTITSLTNSSIVYSTVTSVTGNYSISIEAGSAYQVKVNKTGYKNFTENTSQLTPEQTLTLSAALTPNPSSVSGVVLNSLQQTLPNVKLKIVNTQTSSVVEQILSNADGSYTIGLSAGNYKIVGSLVGHKPDSSTFTLELGQNLTSVNLALAENFALITGNVKDALGVGVSDARVNLTSATGGATAVTGTNGGFTISRLIGDVYSVQVSKTGYSDSTLSNYVLKDGETKQLNFKLFSFSGEISGNVKDVDGNAIQGATVNLESQEYDTRTKITDDVGAYSFNSIAFGEYEISIAKSGYILLDTVTAAISISSPVAIAHVDSLIQNNSKILGNVLDNNGNNIIGASIRVDGTYGAGSTVSNTSGEFLLDQLFKGEYRLQASKDGYSSLDSTFTIEGDYSIDVVLNKNTSKITGTVKRLNLTLLPFTVPVKAFADAQTVYETQTAQDGSFVFDDVQDGKEYQVYTEIFRQGYTNASAKIKVEKGAAVAGPVNLAIKLSHSQISGNVGIGQASITIIETVTNQPQIVTSNTDGNYVLSYLPAATYKIVPAKRGYIFDPLERSVTVGPTDTVTAQFSAVLNAGALTVSAKTGAGSPIEQVNVSVVSADASIVLSGITGSDGVKSFSNVPANTYEVRVSKDGYTANPASSSKAIAASQNVESAFTLTQNTSKVSGVVKRRKDSSVMPGVSIKIAYTENGRVFNATTNNDGIFNFTEIPPGPVVLTATKAGFESDSVSFNLAAGENKVNQNLILTAYVIHVKGKVDYNNSGVQGVNVTAKSNNVISVTTGSDGKFSFVDLPIKSGINDTTIYSIEIDDPNFLQRDTLLTVSAGDLGSTIQLADFIIPSGQITLQFKDGGQPLAGVIVNFSRADGILRTVITGSDGKFISQKNLIAGLYKYSMKKEGYLLPDENFTRIVQSDDTTETVVTVPLSFQFEPIDSIFADQPSPVRITYKSNPDNATAKLFYRKASQTQFASVNMTANGTYFEGSIPALFSLEDIYYHVQVNNSVQNVQYNSLIHSLTPSAKGILSQVQVFPELNNQLLRIGDSYNMTIVIKDGLKNLMTDKFIGASPQGTLTWAIDNAELATVAFADANNKTSAQIKTLKNGTAKLRIDAAFSGSLISKTVTFNIVNIPLREIIVKSPETSISNKSEGVQFNYSAIDTSNRPVFLGSELAWRITPVTSGTISKSGFFVPIDSQYIGNTNVIVDDIISGLSGAAEISIYAEVTENSGFVLSDRKGMMLTLQPGSVISPIQISLSTPQFGPSKKLFNPLGKDESYTVSNQLYKIVYTGGALPGDSLFKAGKLDLPEDNSLQFFEGERRIGLYDPISKEWHFIPSSSAFAKSMISGSFYKFGEYGILTSNESLGFKSISVLPSPFSPQVAPVKIGYFLTSSSPPAAVTIKIFNINGELVKTVLDNDMQVPGKYGSRTSNKEISWDGTTDDGLMARNGRYIIQLRAKDSSGEKVKLTQVILVK
ncbi:MAG: carboxypeptidase regulatory-like domain-containing protein [Bacteroidetes bacterium]|nr:carboxypeptidase regulatory-like domain-containing protein [Bacteroidota bacterium]